MKKSLNDLLDYEKVNKLLEGFNKSTGFVTAILDLEGNILSKSGWRDICTNFHRVHPETKENCRQSDTLLSSKLVDGHKVKYYQCLNGLVDVSVPIIIDNEHVGNLFTGQFFFKEPDKEKFLKQAKKYNFDEAEYLNSLNQVPVISKESVDATMEFLLNMTELIAEMTMDKLRLDDYYSEIKENQEKYQDFISNLIEGFYSVTLEGKLLDYNNEFVRILGLDPQANHTNTGLPQFWANVEDRQKYVEELMKIGFIKDYHVIGQKITGEQIDIKVNARLVKNSQSEPIRIEGTFLDITKSKEDERALREIEEDYSNLFNMTRDGYVINKGTGELINPNPAYCSMVGYTKDELSSMTWKDLTPAKWLGWEIDQQTRKLMERGYTDLYEKEYIRKDGSTIPVEVQAFLLNGAETIDDALIGAFVRDISREKQNRDKIFKSRIELEGQSNTLMKLMKEGVWLMDDVQDAIKKILLSCSDLIRTERVSFWWFSNDYSQLRCDSLYMRSTSEYGTDDVLHCDEAPTYIQEHLNGNLISVENVLSDPRTREIPEDYFTRNDIQSILEVPVRIGNRIGGVLSFENVGKKRKWSHEDERLADSMATLISLSYEASERRIAERALIDRNLMMNSIIEGSAVSMWITDATGTIIRMNEACKRFFNVTDEQIINRYNLFKDKVFIQNGLTKKLRSVFDHGKVADFIIEYNLKFDDKPTNKIVNVKITPIINHVGSVTHSIVQAVDITDLKEKENQLLRSNTLLTSSFESPIEMIILALDTNYKYLYFNKAHAMVMGSTYGSKPEIGTSVLEYISIEEDIEKAKESLDKALQGTSHTKIDVYGEGESAQYFETLYNPIYENEAVIGVTAFAQNITERKKLELELRKHKEKLEELVHERTKELEDKNELLSRFKTATINREFRIKELRDEVRRLKSAVT